MQLYTEKELQEKHAELLKANESLLITEDGQVFFNTPQGKKYAQNHAAVKRVKMFELKAAKDVAKKESTTTKKSK